MRRILLLAGREITRYFDSPLAYITITVFLVINGWMFSSTVFLVNRAGIENFIYNVPLLLLFLAPAVAMQLLAGEFNSGTIEILGTLPVRDEEIIIGKFLAAFTLLATAVLLTLIHPVSIGFMGSPDWGQIAGAYAGMILIGGTFLAAGLFASALSTNQVVAFIIGFGFSFALYLVGKVSDLLPSYARPLAGFIGIDSHWENLSRGVIDIRNLVYFASLWTLFFYGTLVVFSKRVRAGIYKAFSTLILIGILIAVNILADGIVFRADLTNESIYSLSSASKRLMRSLDDPVIVKAYFSENLPQRYGEKRKYLRDLLHEYKAFSRGNLRFSFIDPSEKEELAGEAMRYGIPPLQFTEAGRERFEIQQGYMGLVMIYGDSKEVIPVVENVRGIEYDITTRIRKITSDTRAVIGYAGHLDLSGRLLSNLKERYDILEVPSEEKLEEIEFSSLIVIAGEGFGEEGVSLLEAAVRKDIPLGVFADRYSADLDHFSVSETGSAINGFLENYGLSIGQGLILDRRSQRIGVTTRQGHFTVQNVVEYPLFPLVTDLSDENPAVRDLDAVVFPFVSPLIINEETAGEYGIEVIAKTSGRSWVDENPARVSPFDRHVHRPGMAEGPFPVACALTGPGLRAIVIPNSRFFKEDMLSMNSNEALLLNVIDWLAQDEELIAIRSKGVASRPLRDISAGRKTLVRNLNIFLMPLLLAGFGLYRWKRRKTRLLLMKQRLLP